MLQSEVFSLFGEIEMPKILVIKDTDWEASAMLHYLSRAIHTAGLSHEVVQVTNTRDAILLLGGESFDLLSTDGKYPVRSNPGEMIESEAGLILISRLGKLQHEGHTVFYSGSDEQVRRASNMVVAGKPVHARVKMTQDDVGRGWATISTWANLCVDLLKG